MPANGRWDLIRRLKVNTYCFSTATMVARIRLSVTLQLRTLPLWYYLSYALCDVIADVTCDISGVIVNLQQDRHFLRRSVIDKDGKWWSATRSTGKTGQKTYPPFSFHLPGVYSSAVFVFYLAWHVLLTPVNRTRNLSLVPDCTIEAGTYRPIRAPPDCCHVAWESDLPKWLAASQNESYLNLRK